MRFDLLDGSVDPSNPSKARVSLEGDLEGDTLELVRGSDVGDLESLCALDCCALDGCAHESSTIDGLDSPTGPSLEPGIEVGVARVCFAATSSRLTPGLTLNCVWPR